MTCNYCGSRNSETDHRCRRCGRRPGDTLNNDFKVYRTTGALANKLRPAEMVEPLPLMRSPNLAQAVQGSLFTPNVVAMPNRGGARSGTRSRTAATTTVTAGKPPSRRIPRLPVEGQGELDFFEPVHVKTNTLGTTVDGVLRCDAHVAAPLHRTFAAAIDCALILIGYGVFLFIFAACKGQFIMNRPNSMIFGGALGLIALTYGLLWTVAGTETAGMRWTHLRLSTFDGFPLTGWQRAARFGATCLSLFSVLGILWSLADEEGLGWQDHMTRTFPTAHLLESRVFRRM